MKRFIFASAAALMVTVAVSAQSWSSTQGSWFRKGDFELSAGYALGSFGSGDFGDYNEGKTYSQHGFNVIGDYGLLANIINGKGVVSVGAEVGYGKASDSYTDDGVKTDFEFSRLHIATRGTLHYAFTPTFDTYGGLKFLFVDINKWKAERFGKELNSESKTKPIIPTLFLGARYMFNNTLGVFLETSYDHFAYFTFGLTLKF